MRVHVALGFGPVVLTALLVGCGATGPTFSGVPDLGEDEAAIVVYRPSSDVLPRAWPDVYLNGRKIGEQKEDVGKMWDKAFTLDVPDDFDATVKNTLVLQVQKEAHAAGIWKPVSIVYQDADDN